MLRFLFDRTDLARRYRGRREGVNIAIRRLEESARDLERAAGSDAIAMPAREKAAEAASLLRSEANHLRQMIASADARISRRG